MSYKLLLFPRSQILYGHRSSLESLADTDLYNESKVLVIYTGGTIGMMNNDRGSR